MFENQIAKDVPSGTKLYLFEENNQALRFWVTFWLQKVTGEKLRQRFELAERGEFLQICLSIMIKQVESGFELCWITK